MGCSCCHHTAEDVSKANGLFGEVGLKEVVEQGRGAIAEAGRALSHLNRAERARSLGFGAEVANVQSDAAERANQRARAQARAVLQRIDELVRGDEWSRNAERVRVGFRERGGGRKTLEDAREDVRLRLLEADPGISAAVAGLSLTALDRAIAAASEGDLNQIVKHMRAIMDASLRAFESPEMGGQWIGSRMLADEIGRSGPPPIAGSQQDAGWCAAWYACIAWACASLAACLVLCFVFGFCSAHLACFAGFDVHFAACMVFQPLCSQGHY